MARPAASAKADWRAIETLRLALVTSLREAGVAFSAAVETADAWLLAGLAAEELNLGGASGALQAAAARDYGPVTELVQEVTRVTGLAIALPVSVGGLTRPNAQEGLPFSVFSIFRQHDDPFGTLAQALRTRLVGERDDAYSIVERSSSESPMTLEPACTEVPYVMPPAFT